MRLILQQVSQQGETWSIGAERLLKEKEIRDIVSLFHSGPAPQTGRLGGRVTVTRFSLESEGNLILKFYRRGGLLRYINKEYYLAIGKSRARREFEFLRHAELSGISVPEPVAFVKAGRWFYRTALILREIPDSMNLVDWIEQHGKPPVSILSELQKLFQQLIRAGIHHVDLHPGNVLVDASKNVYLIDFDKARFRRNRSSGPCRSLAARYRRRWNRAIHKYKLPNWLNWDQIQQTSQNPD
jgi:3-deoxy-D-manno-octulosonic acid kinase